jgi:methyl-accepting chemotaxis protein
MMTMERFSKERRKIYYVKKGFQRRFILKYLMLVIAGAVLTNIALYSYSHQLILDYLYSAHIRIKTTGDIMLYPLMVVAVTTLIAASVSVSVVFFVSNRRIAQSLERISEGICDVGGGDLTVRVEADKNDEFFDLFNIFNSTVNELKIDVSLLQSRADEIEAAADNIREERSSTIEAVLKGAGQIEKELLKFKLS